eukprot:g35458.t1
MKQRKIADKNTSLPDTLNSFFAQFEQNASSEVSPILIAPDAPVPTVTAADIRSVFLGIIPRKATGPGGVPGRAFKSCVGQLVEVFTSIFNLSLLPAKVTTCFKKITIIPEVDTAPIYINGVEMERVESVKFLGLMITNNLSWSTHVDATVKKAQQRFFFLRQLRKFGMSVQRKRQKVVCTAQTITKANLPSIDNK